MHAGHATLLSIACVVTEERYILFEFCVCSVQIHRVNSNGTAATDRQEVHYHVSRLRFGYPTVGLNSPFFADSPRFSTHSLGRQVSEYVFLGRKRG